LVSATSKKSQSAGEIGAGARATGEYESSGRNSLSGLVGREINELMYGKRAAGNGETVLSGLKRNTAFRAKRNLAVAKLKKERSLTPQTSLAMTQ
jgi:hypothetical protein